MKQMIWISAMSIFFLCRAAHADTYVGGNIITDTTWSLSNSPYVVTQSVIIYPSCTLTIEPGVQINVTIPGGLNVYGGLVANGTQGTRIIFIVEAHSGIGFQEGSIGTTEDQNGNYVSGSIVKHCEIRLEGNNSSFNIRVPGTSPKVSILDNIIPGSIETYAGGRIENNTLGGPISNFGADSSTIINNNTIESGPITNYGNLVRVENNTCDYIYNSGNSVRIVGNICKKAESINYDDHGVINLGDNVLISQNEITDGYANRGAGVYNEGSDVSITFNLIRNNYMACGGGGGIAIGSSYVSADNVTISDNVIDGNTATARYVAIDGKYYGGYGGGVYIINGNNITVANNRITNNRIVIVTPGFGVGHGGGGIYVLYLSNDVVIRNNIITGNDEEGVYTHSNAQIVGNNVSNNGGVGIYNYYADSEIRGNLVSSNAGHGIYNYGKSQIVGNIITANTGDGLNNFLSNNSLATVTDNEFTENGGNGIYGSFLAQFTRNNIFGNGAYDFRVPVGVDVIAPNNYWGTTTPSVIAGNIYDYWDVINLGEVMYEPVATEPFIIRLISEGDVNGDGTVELDDLVLVLQVIGGIESSLIVRKEADMSKDGKIGLEEVIYILQKVSELR